MLAPNRLPLAAVLSKPFSAQELLEHVNRMSSWAQSG
jgi:hypothetical protein